MDIIDRKIIRELHNNVRLSNQELAEKVNLSPSPCLRRVRRLEKSGARAHTHDIIHGVHTQPRHNLHTW